MTALVTGGGGFLGRKIVRQLRERGEQVRVLGRSRYADLEQTEGVETIQADIRDAAAVAAACEGMEVVYHLAALPGIWGPYETYRSINVDGTRHVLAGCRTHGVERLVYCSSPSVVFDAGSQEGVDESHPYPEHYLAAYPQTKAEAEKLVLAASCETLRTVSLRPHLIWGPGDNQLIPRIIARARAGKLVRVGDGQNLVDVIHVENAARAHLLAATALEPGGRAAGRAYFLSQGEPVNLWQFIDRILAGVGLEPVCQSISFRTAWRVGRVMELAYGLARIQREPKLTRFLAAQLAHSHWFDISAARSDLGYEPLIDTDSGLESLIAERDLVHV